MNTHPILFSTPMVQAILEGRKTMTRRIVKPQPSESGVSFMKNPPLDWEQIYKEPWTPWKWDTEEGETISKNCPYGQIGDILWVRETWYPIDKNQSHAQGQLVWYKADQSDEVGIPWKPSIHMPKAACRIFLKITDIRIERLQDISEEDAKKEGVQYYGEETNDYCDYMYDNCDLDDMGVVTAKESFKTLWERINNKIIRSKCDRKFFEIIGENSWNSNPWVWVISFELTEKPESF